MRTWDRARRTTRQIWRHPANQGRRPRAYTRAVRYQLLSRLGRPVPAPIGRSSAVLARRGETNSPRHVYASPADWPEMLVWPRYLRPGDLFVDVGANIGAYSILALDAGAEVAAVEPDEGARTRLLENLTYNGYTCEVVEAAVGAERGFMSFTLGLDSYNHLVEDAHAPDEAADTRTVPVRTLDDVLGDRTALGVKIDVEGHELSVLQGAERALDEHRIGIIQLEWNHRSREVAGVPRSAVADLLSRHGYGLRRPDERGDLRPVSSPEEGRDVFAVSPRTGW